MRDLLEAAGFTNIVERSDGKYDATKDGMRYEGLVLTGYNSGVADSDVVTTVPVTLVR